MNTTIALSGKLSIDSDIDTLTYDWKLISSPTNQNSSVPSFENNISTIVNPSIRLDQSGEYIFSLTVNDGTVDSVSDTVTIYVGILQHKGYVYGTVKSPFTDRIWLDRNIGASRVCTAYNDTQCYGDNFQWGRNADGHEKLSSATTTTLASDVNIVGASFIKNISSPRDWTTTDSSGSIRGSNWSKTDGSSVCPVGYRVPTINELKEETIDSSDYTDGRTEAFNNFLKFPSAGDRKGSTGINGSRGTYSYIWSSTFTESSSKSYAIFFLTDTSHATNIYRANGNSIRCIKH
ncbi:hypothetical protein MNB_SM-4-1694 [hydrothermal vent metagenome]|uniref:Uncharacterized protein n=1 Tax=hydrothermal vent metagenome TaxID=652676 RepID=A0A1W1CSF5_9ZZZZ